MSLKTANSGFWEGPKHFPGWLAGDAGVILNVPAPNPRVGAKLNHLLCSHCCDTSEIYTLLANYPSVLRTERNHSTFSHFFSSFCKTIVILGHFFFFFSVQYMFFSSVFFLNLRVISCFIWLFLPNALAKYLLCPSRYTITGYGFA